MARLRLVYNWVSCSWVFIFGDSIVRMGDGPLFFATRLEAIAAARARGLRIIGGGFAHVEGNTASAFPETA